ncbi:MAG TPA: DUF362 domain-containing protein [Candidatus Aminicenantes bacterium]|nr:DUF362 domain-containing protein [Candidatus Aminicenantes bacterium]HRY65987.1 DUF362 domain-containing protein [Candidatus Aminicenantes bacterium]HRZ72964.1 DUF362 domain-containing protein [Candidatus Aminicenantes bacterium]
MSPSQVYIVRAAGREPAETVAGKVRTAYRATGFNDRLAEGDFAALKIHFGENNNTGYIKPAWLAGLIGDVRQKTAHAFLTDSNTLYVGRRSNSIDHLRLAWSHGFTPEATGLPVIIADGLIGRDKLEPRSVQARTASSKIAGAILDSDALIGLAHVTGHVQTGLGAAIKNIGMGCASRAGKLDQHSVTRPRVNAKQCRDCGVCLSFCPAAAIVQAEGCVVIEPAKCIGCGECLVVCKAGAIKMKWDEDSRCLQEKMAEYAHRVLSHFQGKAVFINVLIHVTRDCDCMARNQKPIADDIGVLASLDPVAIDQAAADLLIAQAGGGDPLRAGYDIDWSDQLAHGEAIGLGRRAYTLVEIS